MHSRHISALKRAIIMSLVLILSVTACSLMGEERARALPGNGEVIVGFETQHYFDAVKTLDLSESDIDIRITETDKAALLQAARESAFLWLRKVTLFMGDGQLLDNYRDATGTTGFSDKYWQETVDVDTSSLTLTGWEKEELLNYIAQLDKLGTIDQVIKALRQGRLDPGYLSDTALADGRSVAELLENKVNEIYNDKFSDFLVKQLDQSLNVQVEFTIKPLAADGSEDARFGIGGDIKRGTLNGAKEKTIDTVDFGASSQVYDQILNDFYRTGFASDEAGAYAGDDGRTAGEHILFISGGVMHANDDSQLSYAGVRGQYADYPGWHSLLAVADWLGTYTGWCLGIPRAAAYTQTFNLHLNPAVIYMYDLGDADMIEDAQFDKDGRLTSISKPIRIRIPSHVNRRVRYVYDNGRIKRIVEYDPNPIFPSEPGRYRYKLVESGITGTRSNAFLNDDTERYIDIRINDKGYAEAAMYNGDDHGDGSIFKDLSCDITAGFADEQVEFTNVLANTDVKATKVWKDDQNKEELRPSAQTFASKLHLFRKDGDKKTEIKKTPVIKDNGDHTYTAIWEDLPKYKDVSKKNLIEYVVEEEDVPGYRAEIKQDKPFEFTITNTIRKPKFDTNISAAGATGKSDAFARLTADQALDTNEVTDIIHYSDLVKGQTYTVTGRLVEVDENGNKTGEIATITKDFVAADTSGEWKMVFSDVSLAAYSQYVAFEAGMSGDDPLASEKKPVRHEDLKDKAQTIMTENEFGYIFSETPEDSTNVKDESTTPTSKSVKAARKSIRAVRTGDMIKGIAGMAFLVIAAGGAVLFIMIRKRRRGVV